MNRRIDTGFILGIAKNLKYVPAIIRNIKNWPTYLLYYLGMKRGGGLFILRNGVVIRDVEGTLSGTIAVVFIRQHYGSIAGKTTIVEIGANVGTFSLYAAAQNEKATLYSYEPIKENYEVLVTNIAANGFGERIRAFNLGVASRTEKRTFYLQSSPEHSFTKSLFSEEGVTVDCLSLSDVLDRNGIRKIDLLKINAEGAEYEILYSTPEQVFQKIDEIRMEYHEHESDGYDVESLQAFLKKFGYVTTHLYRHLANEGFLWMKREGEMSSALGNHSHPHSAA